jgi:hypothetical protein
MRWLISLCVSSSHFDSGRQMLFNEDRESLELAPIVVLNGERWHLGL